jgi:hypothetical protein
MSSDTTESLLGTIRPEDDRLSLWKGSTSRATLFHTWKVNDFYGGQHSDGVIGMGRLLTGRIKGPTKDNAAPHEA